MVYKAPVLMRNRERNSHWLVVSIYAHWDSMSVVSLWFRPEHSVTIMCSVLWTPVCIQDGFFFILISLAHEFVHNKSSLLSCVCDDQSSTWVILRVRSTKQRVKTSGRVRVDTNSGHISLFLMATDSSTSLLVTFNTSKMLSLCPRSFNTCKPHI